MSYAEPVQSPPPGASPARPTVVTVSTWLLWFTAALLVLGAITSFASMGTISEVYQEAYEGTDAEGQEGITTASIAIAGVLNLLFAAGLVILGIFNNRGKNPSRITTWVVGGVALCCSGVSLVFAGLASNLEVEGGPDPAEVDSMLSDRLPGWIDPLSWVSQIGTILALIVALILLALPAANEFFRKRPEEVFEPPPNYPPPPPPPA